MGDGERDLVDQGRRMQLTHQICRRSAAGSRVASYAGPSQRPEGKMQPSRKTKAGQSCQMERGVSMRNQLSVKKVVLFIGCHPDDVELGCAGAIVHFLGKGYITKCIILTKGEKGGPAEVRVREGIAALTSLGVNSEEIHFGDFLDTGLTNSHETIAFLEGFYGDDVYAVFCPSVNEKHQDHYHASRACRAAFRDAPRLLAYESPTTTPAFTPSIYIDINACLDRKRDALAKHRSQREHGRMYLDYAAMVNLAAFRARQAGNGVQYAEAFEPLTVLLDPPMVGRQRRCRQ